ncbi:hypothetical protein SXCC_02001 [Gluconacetobacter sp. SXCC-1]|nr:hypothetical protein SXCC_02001 [Gluconacetobacter sp. SXCC-1]
MPSLRHRVVHAKDRSTTHRHGSRTKPRTFGLGQPDNFRRFPWVRIALNC